jgi:hypothetical protein
VARADDQHVPHAGVLPAEGVARCPEARPELGLAEREQHQRGRDEVDGERDVPRVEEGVDREQKRGHHADRDAEVHGIEHAGVLPRRAIDAEEEEANQVRQRDERRGLGEEDDGLARHVAIEAQGEGGGVGGQHDRGIEHEHGREPRQLTEARWQHS